jgi:hypothetical protein
MAPIKNHYTNYPNIVLGFTQAVRASSGIFCVLCTSCVKFSNTGQAVSVRPYVCPPELLNELHLHVLDCVWNVTAHAQKPDFFFRRNGRVHLNRRGRQFSRLLAAEVCTSAVVMLDTPCSEVMWRVLATHSIRQFPLQFPSPASPCAIIFPLGVTWEAIGRISRTFFKSVVTTVTRYVSQ